MAQFDELKDENGEINTENIKKIIPYQDPFLFLDTVKELTPNKIVATKKLAGTEDFFKGHFVGFPIMPGALTVEGMGQAATLHCRSKAKEHQDKHFLAYKLKDVNFSSPIFPGDEVTYDMESIAQDERGAIFKGKALVKGEVCAEALFVIAIIKKEDFKAKFSR